MEEEYKNKYGARRHEKRNGNGRSANASARARSGIPCVCVYVLDSVLQVYAGKGKAK